jgi:predicted TPR repeat methyltransferase
MDLDSRNQLIDQMITRGTADDAVQEYIQLGEVYYSLADLTNARKTYAKALRLAQISDLGPDWQIRVLYRIADIDTQSLNWREAMRIYQEICSINPADGKACGQLVELNFRLGERNQAIKAMDRYLQYMNANNRIVEAIQFMEARVEERPEQAAIHRRLGEEYNLVGNQEKALHHLNQTREILMEAGDRVGAMAAIQRIIELDPPDVATYQQLLEKLKAS